MIGCVVESLPSIQEPVGLAQRDQSVALNGLPSAGRLSVHQVEDREEGGEVDPRIILNCESCGRVAANA
jgi:hypothetical protein